MVLSFSPWGDEPEFEWDEYNESEVWGHHVIPDEVEQCFENPYRAIPHNKAKSDPEKYGDRFCIKGQTNGGRKLMIVIQYKGISKIRPITAYDV